jgi:hypothetical protein
MTQLHAASSGNLSQGRMLLADLPPVGETDIERPGDDRERNSDSGNRIHTSSIDSSLSVKGGSAVSNDYVQKRTVA